MKKLDGYILKKYLFTYLYTVLVLVTIICVIDFTENHDDFVSKEAPYKSVLLEYYLNLYPYFANFLSPITIFIATIMVTSRLAAHTEIIAMLSSGMSFLRIMVPYFIGAVLVGVMTFLLLGWVIPNANKTRVAFELKYLKGDYYYADRNVHMKVGEDLYAYLKTYNADINQGRDFTLEKIEFTPEGPKLKEKITAARVKWDKETRKWKLTRYNKRVFKDGKQILSKGSEMDTTLVMEPEDFKTELNKKITLNLPDLYAHIGNLVEKGSADIRMYQVELYHRYSYPFAIIILTMIGVVVSAQKKRGGVGYQIVLGFGLALIFILLVQIGTKFAESNVIPPLASVLMPNIVFTAVGIFLYKLLPK